MGLLRSDGHFEWWRLDGARQVNRPGGGAFVEGNTPYANFRSRNYRETRGTPVSLPYRQRQSCSGLDASLSPAGIVRVVSHDTQTNSSYVVVDPSVKVLVPVVRLLYETVVVQGGKVIVVAPDKGFGGQISDAPGGATIEGVADDQMPGSM